MDRRNNDELILYKLDELKVNIGTVQSRLDEHIESTSHVIHGNGTPGLKSTVTELKTKMTLIWVGMSAGFVAIINDYFNRG
jgi:hypothetical protein